MKEITLKRNINVESYEALMDVWRSKDEYKFLLPVLALSEEGGITDELVNTRLFGVSEDDPRGRRLLEVMEGYRLIEKASSRGVLTNEHSDHMGYRFTERGQLIREHLQQGQYGGLYEELLQDLSRLQILQRTTRGFLDLKVEYSLNHLGKEIFMSAGGILPELPLGVASELETLGIIEPQQNQSTSSAYYELTETGRRALQEDKVLVPERGVFTLTGTTDPLFVEPVIDCQPKEGGKDARQEFDRIVKSSWNGGKNQGKNQDQKLNTPVWFDKLRRATPKVLTLAAQDREIIQITDIDEKTNPVQTGGRISVNVRCSLRSAPEMEVITISGKKEKKTATETTFNLTLMDIMRCLFHAKQHDLFECGDVPTLLVAYDEVKGSPSEINHMRRTTTVRTPEIQGFGRFEDVTVSDLPLLPRTLEDAGSWVRDCLINGITTYTDEISYNQLCDRESTRFSERFDPEQVKSRLPTYQDMRVIVKERREADPDRYWFVTAPALLTFPEGV